MRLSQGHRAILSQRVSERIGVALLTCFASVLLLKNLGNHYLWQDEAQTAVIARTILSHGIPLGYDGKNHFSQEFGREYGDDYVWKWHTWLSFYLAAASFLLLGESTFSARLPFALFGSATVALSYLTGRALWKDRRSAFAGAAMLALSVPFLIFSRQCRYYSVAAFFTLLGLHFYTLIRRGAWRGPLLLFGAVTLLFHTHYIYCATLLATLLLHSLLFDREKLAGVILGSLGVVLLNLPWIVWFSTIRPGGESYAASVLDLHKAGRFSLEYLWLIGRHFFNPLFLLIPLALVAWRWVRGEPLVDVSSEVWKNAALILLFCAVNVAFLSFLSPLLFYRYLTPLAAPLLLLVGLLVGALLGRSIPLGLAVIALWAATGSLRDFAYELTHDFDGPIEGIVRFLQEHARPGDTVAISYGDMPLKFYTDLRVIGGLSGEDIAAAQDADWIIPRWRTNRGEDKRVKPALIANVSAGGYSLHRIDYPDTAFENRETPGGHRFRTAGSEFPRVTIFGRKR